MDSTGNGIRIYLYGYRFLNLLQCFRVLKPLSSRTEATIRIVHIERRRKRFLITFNCFQMGMLTNFIVLSIFLLLIFFGDYGVICRRGCLEHQLYM